MRRGGRAVAAVSALLIGTTAASAWFFPRRGATPAPVPCVLDKCLRGGTDARDPATPGDAARPDPSPAIRLGSGFDFYVLALSWSPGFCAAGGAERAPAQCAPGRELGFVVHGLWPQNTRGYPSDCDSGGSRAPSRSVLEHAGDLYPDLGLARHEWRQHGTCSGLPPSAYFAAVRQARAAVAIPPDFQQSGEDRVLAPRDIARAFTASNRGLLSDAIAVTCRRGTLAEVRLCLTRDLRRFQSCPEVVQDGCRTPTVRVPAPQ